MRTPKEQYYGTRMLKPEGAALYEDAKGAVLRYQNARGAVEQLDCTSHRMRAGMQYSISKRKYSRAPMEVLIIESNTWY